MFTSWSKDSLNKEIKNAFILFWSAMAVAIIAFAILLKLPFLIIFAAYCLYRAFFRRNMMAALQYKRLLEVHGGCPWTRTISFEGDKIFIHEDNYDTTLDRHDIVGVKEKNGCIAISFSNKTVVRLYKDCFVNTDSNFSLDKFIHQLIK